MSINRSMANLIDGSGNLIDGGLNVYPTINDLPTTSLSSGDQAYVTENSRMYISNGSGWYNVALINATPSLTISPTGAITLAKDGTTTSTITLTGTDSDNADANLTYSVDSDGNFGGLATISQDSSVFTITPLTEDSATTTSSTLTFKASDGISFGSGTTTFNLTFSIANSRYTELLLQADASATDNQVDASTSSHSLTEAGGVYSHSFSPYHPGGYSTYFDGTGDYLTFNPGADIAFGTGDFTVEAWVYHTAALGAQAILDTRGGGTANWVLYRDVSNGGRIQWYNGSSNTYSTGTNKWSAQNEWLHIVYCRSGTTGYFFINGELLNTQTDSTNYSTSSTETTIASRYSQDSTFFQGYIRDLRIVKGTAVYTSAFSPPTAALTAISGTSLLVCHAPYIADGSTNLHALTVAGNTKVDRSGPYDLAEAYTKTAHGGSVFLYGIHGESNPGVITASSSADFGFGTGDWTVEFWSWTTTEHSQGNNYIVDLGSNGIIFRIVTDKLTYINLTDSTTDLYTNGAPIVKNTWHHLAVTRISNTIKMYSNGKLVATGTDNLNSSAATLNIGQYGGGGYNYEGYISDLRIVKGTGVYTTNFTPPTAPLTAISGTVLLTCTNKSQHWDTGATTRFNKIGTPTASNTQRKFTGASSLYTGNAAGVLSAPSGYYDFNTQGNFTCECWFYWEYFSHAYKAILAFSNSWDGLAWSPLLMNNDYPAKIGFSGSSGGVYSSTGLVSHSTWYHLAFVKNGTTIKMYLDGTERVSSTNYTGLSNFGVQFPMNIGAYNPVVSDYNFTGYIQDLKITEYAKYTTSFTPPTALFVG